MRALQVCAEIFPLLKTGGLADVVGALPGALAPLGVAVRIAHPLGDVLHVDGDTAVLLSYFRNNVLHLFTASSWIAAGELSIG